MSQEFRQSTPSSHGTFFGVIFMCTFILHLAFAVWVANASLPTETYPLLGNDSRSYAQMARTLLAEGRFYSENAPQVIAQRPPLFPTIIAGAIYTVGERYGLLAIIGLQLCLFALSVALVFRIALFWLSRAHSAVIATLLAIEPATWYTTATLLSDTLFLFLLVSSVYFLVRPRQHTQKTRTLIISAILLGLATLTRSIAQFFPLVILLYIVLDNETWKIRMRNAVLYLVCFLVVVIPWMAWNNIQSGNFVVSTDSVAVHYRHTLPEFLAWQTGQDAQAFREQSLLQLQQRAQEEHRSITSLMVEESSRVILAHPVAYAKFHIIKSLPFFFSDGVRETLVQLRIINEEQPNIGNYLLHGKIRSLIRTIITTPTLVIALVGALCWLVVWVAVVCGVLAPSSRTGIPKQFIVLCVLLIFIQAALIGPASTPRHRMPALPWIYMLAVPGLLYAVSCVTSMGNKKNIRACTE